MPDFTKYTQPTLNALKKASSMAANRYDTYKVGKQAARIAEAQRGMEAAQKGLFARAKFGAGKILGKVGTGFNIFLGGTIAYDLFNTARHKGFEEAAKSGLNTALGFAPYMIPYVGPGIGVVDAKRALTGEKPVSEYFTDEVYRNYLPESFRPSGDEAPSAEENDRPTEPSVSPMSEPQRSSQQQFQVPDPYELKRRQRINDAKVQAYQRGKQILEEYNNE